MRSTLLLLIPLLALGCSPKIKPFFCPVEPAYKADGTMDKTSYNVKTDCLRGLQKRLAACYAE
jgi:hypothetical protein